jgi:hypothetical protein
MNTHPADASGTQVLELKTRSALRSTNETTGQLDYEVKGI